MITSQELVRDPIANYPTATVACFDPTTGDLPRRRLDIAKTSVFLERLAAAGAPAVLIAASTGHGHLRTVEELEEWFRAAAAAELRGCVKMALLRPEDGQRANEHLVGLLAELAYPVVFVRPGTNLAATATEAEIVANVHPLVQLAARCGLAVGVYSIPDVSGVRLTAQATALLLAEPGGEAIVAAKITEADYDASTAEYLTHPLLTRLKIVQGWDPFIAQALQSGGPRVGVTSGPMSFAVHQYQHIFAAAASGDWDEVSSAQLAVTALFSAMQDDPTKFADLQRAKFVMGLGQPLQGEVQPAQVERLLTALRSLPRTTDRARLARSLDLMGDGPLHAELAALNQ
jgi:dihydrodipicolinate synthase/N-acetylneuraminate lyase